MKTQFLTAVVASFTAASVATASMAQMTEIGEGEGALSIVAWAGYVERGETDPAFDWVTGFEEATGCIEGARFRHGL